MLHPVNYHVNKAYPDAVLMNSPPFVLSYRLDYPCDKLYFKHPLFGLAIQQHDAHDVFETVMEIHSQTALEIPIGCCMNDLHLLYQLKGTSRFVSQDAGQPAEFMIHELYYRIVYRSKCEALLCVPPGNHLLVGLVIQRDWLLRYQKKIMPGSPLWELMQHLELQKPICRHSDEIYFDDYPEIQQHIQTLLHLKEADDMEMDLAVYTPSIALLRKNQQLSAGEKPPLASQLMARRVEAIRANIRQLIRDGTRPEISILAGSYKKSPEYFREAHEALYQQSLKDYIIQEQIEEAKRWLSSGKHSIAEVAYHLDFDYTHNFTRMFKKYTDMTPSGFLNLRK